MRDLINVSDRRMVVITDPHIKKSSNNRVFNEGFQLDSVEDQDGVHRSSVFVKDQYLRSYTGNCWPGNSVWIDFLNQRAQKFWTRQYRYENFQGTNRLFHIWIDMNEPSVFSGPEGTLPKTARHVVDDQTATIVLHRDVHNAYGLLMSKATY